MSRPPLPEGQKRVRVDLRMLPSYADKLRHLAEAAGLSQAKYIEALLDAETKRVRKKSH